ncbi:MAG: hypothetical protein FD180_1992 [Planctomycetota bacterium]|nr:MAG: hypothetical protein FD180_1992 [Planctomycetota bacterium]
MTNTRILALALAAALAAGCGDSGSAAKKNERKGPFPVQRNNVAPAQPGSGQPAQPVEADRKTGTVADVPSPPVNPPPLSGNKKGVQPGEDAPELVMEDADGKAFMLSSFRGRQPVLIIFGATW